MVLKRRMIPTRRLGVVLIAGAVIAVLAGAAIAAGPPLKISRVTSIGLDDQDADDIIGAANEVLFLTDGGGDVSCRTDFTRDGRVEDFSSPDAIRTAQDYQAVCAEPGRVQVVKSIEWCNNESCPNCQGCSDRPGPCMVVVRDSFLQKEGVLWAHEYGHNAGLCDVAEDKRVMNRDNAAANRRVTATECTAFQGPPASIATCSVSHQPTALDTFLRRDYIHGTPYAEARAYLKSHTPRELLDTLGKSLRDPALARYHDNVALTLGYIGDPAAFDLLVEFIQAPGTELTHEQLVARRSAMVALGYLYFHSEEPRVLKYLSEAVLSSHDGRLRAQMPKGSPTLAESLRVASFHALGITGTPQAVQILQQALPKSGDTTADRAISPAIGQVIGQVIEESLELNQRVQKYREGAFQMVGQHR